MKRLPVFIAALIMMAFVAQQAIVAYDSRDFIAASRSLRMGEGYRMSGGEPFTMWPPLYPTLLALFRDPVTAGRWINVVCIGLTMLLAGIWLERRGIRPPLSAVIMLSALVVHGYLPVAQSLLTEPLYLVFVFMFLLAADHMDTGRGVLVASIAAALAIAQRHMGAVLVVVGVIELSFRGTHRPMRILAFILLPLAVMLAWDTRNVAVSGSWDGNRSGPDYSLWQNLQATGEVLWTLRGAVGLVVASVIGERGVYAAYRALRRVVADHVEPVRQ